MYALVRVRAYAYMCACSSVCMCMRLVLDVSEGVFLLSFAEKIQKSTRIIYFLYLLLYGRCLYHGSLFSTKGVQGGNFFFLGMWIFVFLVKYWFSENCYFVEEQMITNWNKMEQNITNGNKFGKGKVFCRKISVQCLLVLFEFVILLSNPMSKPRQVKAFFLGC